MKVEKSKLKVRKSKERNVFAHLHYLLHYILSPDLGDEMLHDLQNHLPWLTYNHILSIYSRALRLDLLSLSVSLVP